MFSMTLLRTWIIRKECGVIIGAAKIVSILVLNCLHNQPALHSGHDTIMRTCPNMQDQRGGNVCHDATAYLGHTGYGIGYELVQQECS